MIWVCVLFGLLTVYTAICNGWLIRRYDKVCDELADAHKEIDRIKSLNRLKVDYNGNPINYEFILDAQTAVDMLDNPAEPNENLIELLRMK